MNTSVESISRVLLLLPLAVGTAHATGFATDTELMRPSFSPDTVPGLETAKISGEGSYRAGVVLQYLRDPLVVKLYGYDAGSVVENRIAAHVGGSYDVKDWLSARIAVPVAFQSGADVEEFAADGFGLGDLRLGARAALPSGKIFHPGLRVDIDVPVGYWMVDRPDDNGDIGNYMSEQAPRFTGGLLVSLDLGPTTLNLDGGFTGRKEVDTPADFLLGSELVLNGGVILHVWEDKLNLGTAILSRAGAKNLWQPDAPAENAAELFTDVSYRLTRNLQLDVGVGRGVTSGYGSTGLRTLASITYIYAPPPPPPEVPPTYSVTEQVKPPPEPIFDEPADRQWEEGQLARVSGLSIEIKDPILFEFGTPVIRDVSYPTLKSVAAILQAYGQIDHLLIEGHASEEGSFEYNYNLSTSRAQAVFNKLIEFGVHPDRLSYRGMGETVPVVQGDSEEALAANRRVEFDIIKLLDPLAPIPKYPDTIKLPWNGEVIKAVQPGSTQIGSGPAPGVTPRPVEDKEKIQEDFFNSKSGAGDDDDWPMPTGGGGTDDTTGEDQ